MPQDPREPRVRVDVHDASHLEWVIRLPLSAERQPLRIEAGLEIPATLFVPSDPWEQLERRARLESPAEERPDAPVGLNPLRRQTLRVARWLKLERRRRPEELAARLEGIERTLLRSREQVAAPRPEDSPQLAKERQLSEDFLSHRWLDFLAGLGSARPLRHRRGVPRRTKPRQAPRIEVTPFVARELERRKLQKLPTPHSSSSEELERYLEHAAQLKKHFQEVLFLDAETSPVNQRVRNLVRSIAAAVAALLAFLGQRFIPLPAPVRTSFNILWLALLAVAIYVIQDRVKDVGRDFLTGRITRLYGDYLTRFYPPPWLGQKSRPLAKLRESFWHYLERSPDPLNPAAGRIRRVASLRYQARGSTRYLPALEAYGIRGLKLIYRYDLAPFLSRLDDTPHPVPVVDGQAPLLSARRSYRFPLFIEVELAGERKRWEGEIVTRRAAILRLEERKAPRAALAPTGQPTEPVTP